MVSWSTKRKNLPIKTKHIELWNDVLVCRLRPSYPVQYPQHPCVLCTPTGTAPGGDQSGSLEFRTGFCRIVYFLRRRAAMAVKVRKESVRPIGSGMLHQAPANYPCRKQPPPPYPCSGWPYCRLSPQRNTRCYPSNHPKVSPTSNRQYKGGTGPCTS